MQTINRRTMLAFLGVASITQLLPAAELETAVRKSRAATITKPGENRFAYSTGLGAKENPCKVTSEDSAGGLSIFENIVPSHFGPPLHVHHHEDEWFYVLTGDFVFEIDGKQTPVSTGGSVFGPRDIPHRWANVGKDTSRLIVLFQPGGFEKFFDDLYAILEKDPLIEPSKLAGLYKKYDMELLGPMIFPLPAPPANKK